MSFDGADGCGPNEYGASYYYGYKYSNGRGDDDGNERAEKRRHWDTVFACNVQFCLGL